jgi:hypothetical protein
METEAERFFELLHIVHLQVMKSRRSPVHFHAWPPRCLFFRIFDFEVLFDRMSHS